MSDRKKPARSAQSQDGRNPQDAKLDPEKKRLRAHLEKILSAIKK